MDKFPLFIDLTGRKVLIFGGGAVARRRAGVLLRYGAAVTVVAPEVDPELERLPILLERRSYRPGEIRNAFLVVAATDNLSLNAQITREARAVGAWANNASDHDDCDFFFPAVVRRESLSIGITGTGENHRQVRDAAERIRRMEL